MAANAIVHKVNLNISDVDTHYYAQHSFTLAQHSSETELHFMVRLVAFILNADEALHFTKGIASEDAPDLVKKNILQESELAILIGQADEKQIKKSSKLSEKVIIYTYEDAEENNWLKQNEKLLNRFSNLEVVAVSFDDDVSLLCKRSMNLQCNIADKELFIIDEHRSVQVRTK